MTCFARLALVLALISTACDRRDDIEVETSAHTSSLHRFSITQFKLDLPGPPGGGIAALGSGYLAATGGGELYWFERKAPDALSVVRLPHRVPINREEFLRYADQHRDELGAFLADSFRTNDLLVIPAEDVITLLVSYTYWHEAEACYALRVSASTIPPAALLNEGTPLPWDVLFESEPCLQWKSEGHGFAGQQAAGEMALSPDGKRILLSVGDFEFDGLNDSKIIAQDQDSPYGKLLSIDRATGDTVLVASGVRNAQGIAIDEAGRVWTTEHGPQGGDELNQIVLGENYGWPYVTYGTHYGRFDWPLALEQSEHEGFAAPIFAWVPSVGTSDLLILKGRAFAQWRGDLLVSALKTRELLRVRIRNGRVAYVEPVPVDTRTRDMIEDRDGAIVLWTDTPDLRFVEYLDETDAYSGSLTQEQRGELLFAACSGCHAIEEGAADGIGPNLWGIMNARIASSPGYAYSAALRTTSGAWTTQRLDAYVADPPSFARGTTMQYDGLKSEADRSSLIAFLAATSR